MVSPNANEDLSMLELFRIEAENCSRVLEAGLIELESNQSAEKIEPLMRAAHSIKGAARIVGLNKAVTLAHSMEDILSAAKKGEFRLSSSDIDLLLNSNDFFKSISIAELDGISSFLNEKQQQIEELAQKIELSLKGKNEKQVLDIKNNIDFSLIELFKSEIKTNSALIKKSMEGLSEGYSKAEMSNLIRAVHSIRGASRIIGFHSSAELSAALENELDPFSKDEKLFNENQIAVINEVFEFYEKLLETNENDFIKEADELNIKIKQLIGSINKFFSDISQVEPAQSDESQAKKEALIGASIAQKETKQEEALVRVMAENLSKLLGFAGECLVEARKAKSFSTHLLNLKRRIMSLSSYKEDIFQELADYNISEEIIEKFSDSTKELDAILSLLVKFIEQFENFSLGIETSTEQLYNEALATRMRPFSEALHGFTRMTRDLSQQLKKKVNLEIIGKNTRIDKDILEKLEAPLNHLIRNAIDHGVESPEERLSIAKNPTATITLEARHFSGMLIISVKDDGAGIDLEKLRKKIVKKGYTSTELAADLSKSELIDFLFLPGFSTSSKVSEISGRGVGLDIVFSMVHSAGGTIKANTELGKGTTIELQLPLTLSIVRALLFSIQSEIYAIALTRIDRVLKIHCSSIQNLDGKQYYTFEKENIALIDCRQIFGYEQVNRERDFLNVIVISDLLSRFGIVVDEFNGEADLVVIPLNKQLGRIASISAGAILSNGTEALILDVQDLVRYIHSIFSTGKVEKLESRSKVLKNIKRVLVVDDSLTVRETERRMLEKMGYEVTTAIDGIDGWNALHREDFDLLVSDIDMPRMNGIDLVKRVKSDEKLKSIPVMIVSYKDREEDKRLGLEAGANYFFTKSSFRGDALIEAVEDLIGKVE